eukprot:755854-Hanusia_phi.AAC.3
MSSKSPHAQEPTCRTISELATAAEPNVDAMRVVAGPSWSTEVEEKAPFRQPVQGQPHRHPPGAEGIPTEVLETKSLVLDEEEGESQAAAQVRLGKSSPRPSYSCLQYRESESASPAPATPWTKFEKRKGRGARMVQTSPILKRKMYPMQTLHRLVEALEESRPNIQLTCSERSPPAES